MTIIIVQCRQLGYIPASNKIAEIVEFNYVTPFFEQNWGMFSPNPPKGKKYIAIEFFTEENKTALLNIHEAISQNNKQEYFSLNQRLLKYLIECANEVASLKGVNEKEVINNSFAVQSIKNYALYVLKKQDKFLSNIQAKDSVFINLYVIDEQNYQDSTVASHIAIKDIYLTTKK